MLAGLSKNMLQSLLISAHSRVPLNWVPKNLGRLWLAYTELQVDFYMLQLILVDSRHFLQSSLSLGWSDLHEIKTVSFCISNPN